MWISKLNILRMYYAAAAFAAGYVLDELFGTQSLVFLICIVLGAIIAKDK